MPPIDPAGVILFFAFMVWSFKPADMLTEASASATAAGGSAPAPRLTLERDAIASEAFRLSRQHRAATFRFGLAMVAAGMAHAGVFAWFHWLAHQEIDRLGAAGSELAAISVEVLAPSEVSSPVGTSGPGSNAAEDSAEAQPSAPAPTTPPPPAAQAATDNPPLLTTDEPARFTVPLVETPPDMRVADATPRPEPEPQPQPVEHKGSRPQPEPAPRKTPEPEPQLSPAATEPAQPAAAPSVAGGAASMSAPAPSPAPPAASPGAIQAYAKSIVEALGRTTPKSNLLQGARGTVKLAFSVADDGGLEGVRIVRSSGTPRIDELALRAIKSARFPPPPPGMTLAQRTYEIPYVFR